MVFRWQAPSRFPGLQPPVFYLLKQLQKLRKPSDFRRLRLEGKSVGNVWLGLQFAPNSLPNNRWGLSVGRRIGCAVMRNRIRRRLREIVRLRDAELKTGWDGVVVARHRAGSASYQQLEAGFFQLAVSGGLTKDNITREASSSG